jgi:hypothetical protein
MASLANIFGVSATDTARISSNVMKRPSAGTTETASDVSTVR